MSYANILAELKSELNEIIPTDSSTFATIGNVHDYVRVQNMDNTRITFKKSRAVCPEWFLTRTQVRSDLENQPVKRQHTFILRGYYPINDTNETEKKFQGLVEDILNHFNWLDTLNAKVWFEECPQLTRFESIAIMLDGTYVHFCEITFDPVEYVTS
jgi:hypothetical protein